ncbi:MAG: hypothetical protein ACK5JM_00225 [Rhodoblastus sp.]
MNFIEFEHRVLPRIIVPLLAGLMLVAVAGRSKVQAAEQNSFIISDLEGYGIADCLTNGSSCGRVVADAWCEAHGYGQSVAFGRADDVTAAIKNEPGKIAAPVPEEKAKLQTVANQVRSNSLIVTCER